ncbi:hypothetical protein [Rhodococcus jostii]
MDDEEVFGPVFLRLGFAEAIERELLTDYQVAVVDFISNGDLGSESVFGPA